MWKPSLAKTAACMERANVVANAITAFAAVLTAIGSVGVALAAIKPKSEPAVSAVNLDTAPAVHAAILAAIDSLGAAAAALITEEAAEEPTPLEPVTALVVE